jgi:hypothetical protein
MVDLGLEVYSKMKPDSLRLQLQTVLITYYEDIKGVVSASCCTKPKVVKGKFVTKMPQTPPPPSPPTPMPTLMPPPPPPRRTGAHRRCTRTRRGGASTCPHAGASLNLIQHDTRQQPVPAYRPANLANQKAASCTYLVQQCLYIS